jgi:hypothetical protein
MAVGAGIQCWLNPITYEPAGVPPSWGGKDAPTHDIRLPYHRGPLEHEDGDPVHFTHRAHVVWPRHFRFPRWGVWYSPFHS